jgi:hypothetical protein
VTEVVLEEFEKLDKAKHSSLIQALSENRLQGRGISLAARNPFLPDFAVECQPFVGQRDDWWVSRWVGNFAIDTIGYTLQPRVGWPRFYAMLANMPSIGVLANGGSTGNAASGSDLTALAWVLAHEEAWRRHRGPAKAFVRREEAGCAELRGELDLDRQLAKLPDQMHTLACRYDELTFDHPVNRGSRLALRQLARRQRFPYNGNSDFRRLAQDWDNSLAVNQIEAPAHFPADLVRWSLANSGFRTAHALAEQVVAERQHDADRGRQQAFLFDAAEIWELYLFQQIDEVIQADFKGMGLRVEWPRARQATPDHLLIWDGHPVGMLIRDIEIRRDDNSLAVVIDAKSRTYQSLQIDTDIARQMFNYVASAPNGESHPPPAVLLYPSCGGINPSTGDGPFQRGSGEVRMRNCSSAIQAWAIRLPEPDKEEITFHEDVQRQLRNILSPLIAAGK